VFKTPEDLRLIALDWLRKTPTAKGARAGESSNSWRHGVMVNIVGRINEVNQRRARLVLGWVTIFRRVNRLGT